MPLYEIRKIPSAEITLDGKMDEAVYDSLPALDWPFWMSEDDGLEVVEAPETLRIRAKLFYTDEAVFLGVHVSEPRMGIIRLSYPAGRHQNAWKDDCIEFFFDFERAAANYLQWVTTARGAFARYVIGRTKTGGSESIPSVKAAGAVGAEAYGIEIRVPREQLLGAPEDLSGCLASGNLRRFRWIPPATLGGGGGGELKRITVSWSKMRGGHHNPQGFHLFRFE